MFLIDVCNLTILNYYFRCCPEGQVVVQGVENHQIDTSLSERIIRCANNTSNNTQISEGLGACEFGEWEHIELREQNYDIQNEKGSVVITYQEHEFQKEMQFKVDSSNYCVG